MRPLRSYRVDGADSLLRRPLELGPVDPHAVQNGRMPPPKTMNSGKLEIPFTAS